MDASERHPVTRAEFHPITLSYNCQNLANDPRFALTEFRKATPLAVLEKRTMEFAKGLGGG
jgi:hypothetical protein